ncbi:MAG: DUF4398 and OmpA-like domain-containing protein [Thiopseudomonas sp.]|uniref:OmpA family protein n=1 Tax=Denitrificimonas caeni TaxID=521720 RepID=UPI0003B5E928|nr:OmpA family protein [Denitrificimonas caeni]MBP8007726.1 DUF4398 and OmpA-like domain-containing protein [Thiopseudomonas sp.]HHX05059.1 OmpA family protein [Pseudomonas sp.]
MSTCSVRRIIVTGALLSVVGLTGCAHYTEAEQALQQADELFNSIKDDSQVLASAPKDVLRAGESLQRAEQLSGYLGSTEDVQHFAYLSQQYAHIAQERSQIASYQQQIEQLRIQRERLQLALREARLMSVQQQGQWLEEQMISLATQDAERGLVLTLNDMLFDSGRADLKPAANRTVLKLVQFLQMNGQRTVRIEGYSDSDGDVQENLQLSKDRAQAVADTLVDLGVDVKRLQVMGYGDAFPIAENATERGRAQNRRVEIVFSDEVGRLAPERE